MLSVTMFMCFCCQCRLVALPVSIAWLRDQKNNCISNFENQKQEKHSVQREPDGHKPHPIPKTEMIQARNQAIDTDNATRRH